LKLKAWTPNKPSHLENHSGGLSSASLNNTTSDSVGERGSNNDTLQSLLQLLVNNAILGSTTNNAYQIMLDLSQTIGDFIGESEIGGEAMSWLM